MGVLIPFSQPVMLAEQKWLSTGPINYTKVAVNRANQLHMKKWLSTEPINYTCKSGWRPGQSITHAKVAVDRAKQLHMQKWLSTGPISYTCKSGCRPGQSVTHAKVAVDRANQLHMQKWLSTGPISYTCKSGCRPGQSKAVSTSGQQSITITPFTVNARSKTAILGPARSTTQAGDMMLPQGPLANVVNVPWQVKACLKKTKSVYKIGVTQGQVFSK